MILLILFLHWCLFLNLVFVSKDLRYSQPGSGDGNCWFTWSHDSLLPPLPFSLPRQCSKFFLAIPVAVVYHLLEGKLPFAVSFRTRQIKNSSLVQRRQVHEGSILAPNYFQCYKYKIGVFFYCYRTNFANCKTETETNQVHLLEPATSEQTNWRKLLEAGRSETTQTRGLHISLK